MTDDNKDQLRGKDLLVAYYDVDYDKNPKGSNYWRNRYGKIVFFVFVFFSPRQASRRGSFPFIPTGAYLSIQ